MLMGGGALNRRCAYSKIDRKEIDKKIDMLNDFIKNYFEMALNRINTVPSITPKWFCETT